VILVAGDPWLEGRENRAATGRERNHERRTSTTLSAFPSIRGSVTPSNGSTVMSHTNVSASPGAVSRYHQELTGKN
jgi:hypothetical protein